MGRSKHTSPVRGNSKAAGPARTIPAGFQKCGMCGKTLPDLAIEPGFPPEWTRCRECHKRALADERNPWKSPGNF